MGRKVPPSTLICVSNQECPPPLLTQHLEGIVTEIKGVFQILKMSDRTFQALWGRIKGHIQLRRDTSNR